MVILKNKKYIILMYFQAKNTLKKAIIITLLIKNP
jgi:hypothetical protein